MSFFNEEERKEVVGSFFQWESGKTYHLKIKKGWSEGFAKNSGYELLCEDVDAKTTFSKKWDFALLNALDKLGDSYTEDAVITVIPTLTGKRPSKDGTKEYDVFSFHVGVTGAVPASSPSVPF